MNMEKASSYGLGDWIVHCHHGVGQIKKIERLSINDKENNYFRVKTVDKTFWIPVNKIDDEYIRPITDKAYFQEAVNVLENPPKELASNSSSRKSRIKSVIVHNIPIETARLIRDLRGKRRSKKGLNQNERRALRNLTKRFVQEWAVTKDLTIEQARQKFNRKLSARRAATESHSRTVLNEKSKGTKSSLIDTLMKNDKRWSEWLDQKLGKGM